MRDESINRIMTLHPQAVCADDSLAHVVGVFNRMQGHHLPVVDVDNQTLVGMISTADIAKQVALAESKQRTGDCLLSLRMPISTVMTKNPLSIPLTASLRVAAQKLCTGNIHCLPVVDHNGHLVGIVTSTDLIQHLFFQVPSEDGSLVPVAVDALQERLRLLEDIRIAIEYYLRTGHGEREHQMLLEKLAAITNTSLHI